MPQQDQTRRADRSRLVGLAATTLAFLTWGALPVYWKWLGHVDSIEIIAHRVLWTLATTAVLLAACRRWGEFRPALRRRRDVAILLVSSVLLVSNWFTYVWGINHERILETSLGYFITPLVTVILGWAVLRERLRPAQVVAFVLAAAGVANLAAAGRVERFPWVALTLAGTFSLYALIRKTSRLESLPGLTAETAVLSVPAAALLAVLAARGGGALGRADWQTHLLLAGVGVVTAAPLLLFAYGARRIRLTAVGFLQYLAPTGTFCLGLFVYREPFGRAQAITFGLIWTGLAVYTADSLWRAARAGRSNRAETE